MSGPDHLEGNIVQAGAMVPFSFSIFANSGIMEKLHIYFLRPSQVTRTWYSDVPPQVVGAARCRM
jgi:hypothetical protein